MTNRSTVALNKIMFPFSDMGSNECCYKVFLPVYSSFYFRIEDINQLAAKTLVCNINTNHELQHNMDIADHFSSNPVDEAKF